MSSIHPWFWLAEPKGFKKNLNPSESGECCKFPQWGLGWSPSRHRFLRILWHAHTQPSLRTQFKVATVYLIPTQSLSWCSTRHVLSTGSTFLSLFAMINVSCHFESTFSWLYQKALINLGKKVDVKMMTMMTIISRTSRKKDSNTIKITLSIEHLIRIKCVQTDNAS